MIKASLSLLLVLGIVNCQTVTPEDIVNNGLKIFNTQDHAFAPSISSDRRSFMLTFVMVFYRASDDKHLLDLLTERVNGFFQNVHNVQFAYNYLWSNPIVEKKNPKIMTDNKHILEYLGSINKFAVEFSDFDIIATNFTVNKNLHEKCEIIRKFKFLVQTMYDTLKSGEIMGLVVQLFNIEQSKTFTDEYQKEAKRLATTTMLHRLTRTMDTLNKCMNKCSEQTKTCS